MRRVLFGGRGPCRRSPPPCRPRAPAGFGRATALATFMWLALCGPPRAAAGQTVPDSARTDDEPVRVFVDCRSQYCDFDHIRREIAFVRYVRDRLDAQVHVLVTARRTGGGGDELSLAYLGLQDFREVDDSLVFFSSDTDTFDEVRDALTRRLALGLARYAARTGVADRLRVVSERPDSGAVETQAPNDPWDFWVFRIEVGGAVAGEKRERSASGKGALTANRTTETWKIELWANGSYGRERFTFDDGTDFVNTSRESSAGGFVVRSLGEHWSMGTLAVAESSTFQNLDLGILIGPAVEYNVFPYSESTRRALTLLYLAVFASFDYEEETIFDKTAERRMQHNVQASYAVKQPWGSSSVTFKGTAFWDDVARHSLELRGSLNLRLIRGLEFNINGALERIKDQIFLPKGGASTNEILLRRRELGTDYRYALDIGFSFRFGSIYNNVVNPRF